MQIGREENKSAYSIYLGMNDKDTLRQEIDTNTILRIVRNVCKGYRVSFSTYLQHGGYIHEDGEFVQENSIVLRLIGVSPEDINAIGADLCCFFNQECVLIERQNSTYYTVSEKIDLP